MPFKIQPAGLALSPFKASMRLGTSRVGRSLWEAAIFAIIPTGVFLSREEFVASLHVMLDEYIAKNRELNLEKKI
jgi:hypothetical protein